MSWFRHASERVERILVSRKSFEDNRQMRLERCHACGHLIDIYDVLVVRVEYPKNQFGEMAESPRYYGIGCAPDGLRSAPPPLRTPQGVE